MAWLGLEYFVNEGDELWSMSDNDLVSFAAKELDFINMIESDAVVDYCIVKEKKAYPAYFGTYDHFSEVVSYVNRFKNLLLIGRNGMHRYNNQDHSMLTAIVAVQVILGNKEA